MTYLGDLREAERQAAAARAARPQCTRQQDCPAEPMSEHLLDCHRYRRERLPWHTDHDPGPYCDRVHPLDDHDSWRDG